MADTAPAVPAPRRPRRLLVFLLGALLMAAGALTAGVSGVVLDATNRMEFCISCHSMKINFEEYRETVHYKSRTGVRATCADCHVPQSLGPKLWAKFMAYKDVLHELLGTIATREKFEAHRWEMANRVWAKMRANDSRECRTCHRFEQMDLSRQSRMARAKHGKAVEGGKTCIDCHQGIAHQSPEEPEGDGVVREEGPGA